LSEQLIFGLQELQTLKHLIAVYDSWFSNTETATVLLVTVGVGPIYLALFCVLKGGRAGFRALTTLNLPALGEVHHLVETAYAGHYTPGTATAVPYIVCGVLFLHALISERRLEAVDALLPERAADATI